MHIMLPEGLTVRPPTMDDLPIVHELCLAYDLAYYGEENMTLEDLRTYWTASTHDLARDQRLAFDQTGRLVGTLYLEQHQFAKFFIDVQIHPSYRNPRLGDALFELGETWVRERMVQAAPEARVTLNAWTYSTNHDSLERCVRMGLQENRRYWDMAIELNEPPVQPEWSAGMAVRPFAPERDGRAVFEMMDTAFSDHWGHLPGNFEEWSHRKLERPDFDSSLWFIAYEGDQIAGGALCSQSAQGGWINTLGVLCPWRRHGVGLALLRHAFGEFYRRGLRKAGLGVDSQNLTGATRLYKRAGMFVKRENISFEKELRAGMELSIQVLEA